VAMAKLHNVATNSSMVQNDQQNLDFTSLTHTSQSLQVNCTTILAKPMIPENGKAFKRETTLSSIQIFLLKHVAFTLTLTPIVLTLTLIILNKHHEVESRGAPPSREGKWNGK